jgi:TM2 domain-containing membrane protein YozV
MPQINSTSQQPINCHSNGKAIDAFECNTSISIANSYNCKETGNSTFYRDFEGCKWTNGYEFDTALLLSIFLGMFGVDRFYLGYPAIGLLKFSTLGFFFLGHLLDVILIASQILGPADGSYYVVSYFGPAITILSTNGGTDRRPESDWFVPKAEL